MRGFMLVLPEAPSLEILSWVSWVFQLKIFFTKLIVVLCHISSFNAGHNLFGFANGFRITGVNKQIIYIYIYNNLNSC